MKTTGVKYNNYSIPSPGKSDFVVSDTEVELLQKQGVSRVSAKGRWFVDVLVESGITGYTVNEGGNILIKEDLLQQFAEQFIMRPLYINHINEDPDKSDRKVVGYVTNTGVDGNKVWAEFIVIDEEANRLLIDGWQTSSSWVTINGNYEGGVHNGIKYFETPLDIKAEHVAIVPKGRHESQKKIRLNSFNIMTNQDKVQTKDELTIFERAFEIFTKFGLSKQNSETSKEEEKKEEKKDNAEEQPATIGDIKEMIMQHIKEYHDKFHAKKENEAEEKEEKKDNAEEEKENEEKAKENRKNNALLEKEKNLKTHHNSEIERDMNNVKTEYSFYQNVASQAEDAEFQSPLVRASRKQNKFTF